MYFVSSVVTARREHGDSTRAVVGTGYRYVCLFPNRIFSIYCCSAWRIRYSERMHQLFLIFYCHTTGITLMRENVYIIWNFQIFRSGRFFNHGNVHKMRFREMEHNACFFKISIVFDIFFRSLKSPLHIALKIGHGVVRL